MLLDTEALKVMREHDPDLTSASLVVFSVVCEHEGLTVGEIESRAGLPKRGGRRAFRQLVDRATRNGETMPGLVTLEQHEDDGRYKRVFLTTQGEQMRKQIQVCVKKSLTGQSAAGF